MAKFCEKCGTPLVEGMNFCTNCGAPVPVDTPTNAPQQGAPVPNPAPQPTPAPGPAPQTQGVPSPNGAQPHAGLQGVTSPKPNPAQGFTNTTSAVQGKVAGAPNPSNGGADNKKPFIAIIIGVVALLIVAVAGGFFYYHHEQQVKIEKMQAEQAAQAKAQAEKAAQEKAAVEQKAKQQDEAVTQAYVKAALFKLMQGEDNLKSLANMINSGGYREEPLLEESGIVVNSVKARIKAMKEMPVPSDPQVAKDVDELFNIQIQRANFMADGVRGDTSKFAVGGQYYDMFYEKLAAFKKAHGVN